MACPFFMPTQKSEAAFWPHPSRLPLGAGWDGRCFAPGHEGIEPAPEELRDGCNLGYPKNCPKLPKERSCDAVRFGVARDTGTRVHLLFVCEAKHLPMQHGTLEYDASLATWISPHPDPRIQKMAECYLESYRARKNQNSTSSTNDER